MRVFDYTSGIETLKSYFPDARAPITVRAVHTACAAALKHQAAAAPPMPLPRAAVAVRRHSAAQVIQAHCSDICAQNRSSGQCQ